MRLGMKMLMLNSWLNLCLFLFQSVRMELSFFSGTKNPDPIAKRRNKNGAKM